MSRMSRSCRVLVPALGVFALSFLVAPVSVAAQDEPERSGFTLLLSLGVGIQNDKAIEESATGGGGLNLGIGGFGNERTPCGSAPPAPPPPTTSDSAN